MNYVTSKNIPEISDKGFIIGNKFVKIKQDISLPPGYLDITKDSWTWIGQKNVNKNVITWSVPSGAYVENTTPLNDASIGFWMNGNLNLIAKDGTFTPICVGSNGYNIANVLMFWINDSTFNTCGYGSATKNGGKIIVYNSRPSLPCHIILMKSNNVLSLYINGEEVGSDTWNISYQYSRITIGGGFWNGNFVWNEDAFQQTFPVIYPRVLTQDEIQQLYKSSKPTAW